MSNKPLSQSPEERIFGRESSGVSLRNVTKVFPGMDNSGEFVAVDHIDLEIGAGEMVTLLGPSGCGKTTTLRMISGFEYPTSGEIRIGGNDVANVPPNKRNISMVFQSYALFPHMSVWENVAYGLYVKKLDKPQIKERTDQVMRLMRIEGMKSRFPNQLSGGQQQRVALARAVVLEPKVLLFDEPLSNLDAKLRERMRDEIRLLQERLGITSLYVTHDQSEAMAISDKVVIMRGGKIAQMGTPREIYEYPVSKFVANFIGRANFISGKFKSKRANGSVVEIGGREFLFSDPGPASFSEGSPVSVAFRPESVRFGDGNGCLPAVITRAVYFGSRIEYEAELLGSKIAFEIYNPQLSVPRRKGETVSIVLDLACARLLPEEELKEE